MKKIYIGGMPHSGKGLLRMLLDGHPRIITCPFQHLGASLMQGDFKRYCQRDRQPRWRLRFAETRKIRIRFRDATSAETTPGEVASYLLQNDVLSEVLEYAIIGKIFVGPSQAKQIGFDFQFDYNHFLKKLITKLGQIENDVDIDILIDSLYTTFIDSWVNLKNKDKTNSYFTQTVTNGLPIIQDILENNKKAHVFVVFRDPAAICYSYAKVRVQQYFSQKSHPDSSIGNVPNEMWESFLFDSDMIKEIIQFRSAVAELQTSGKLVTVSFEDLIHSRSSALLTVCDNLGIELSETMLQPSVNGIVFNSKDAREMTTIKDDLSRDLPTEILTRLEACFSGHTLNFVKQSPSPPPGSERS